MDWVIWAYRELYWCKRSLIKQFCPVDDEDVTPGVHTDSLPWLWIGVRYNDDSITTVTHTVNDTISYGTWVTPKYLTKITGLSNGKWLYVDSKTLEEKEFPSDGFVIEDVSDKPIRHSE